MRTFLLAASLIVLATQPALANKSPYQVCVETCLAWEGKADPKDIRRCIADYCKRYSLEDILKKADYFIDDELHETRGEEEI